ncbi:acyl-CoA Delta-9 desaturase-like [Phymastichus coffea]|uniref:acyl-CoA Delta-9 desaturase-like n=1 Tax=Phymastichus coffea TaxID=108790 RepID=UPI00273BC756|nr:acyl-CoA Delta-9 desaturase-like [Phymastichus coffea]
MPPKSTSSTADEHYTVEKLERNLENIGSVEEFEAKKPYDIKIVWKNVIILSLLHVGAFYGLYLVCTSAKVFTFVFTCCYSHLGGMGITAGVHRLWAHRAYKAKWQLRLLLTFCNTIAFQDPVIHWARDHRLHHRHAETDADPYNAKRGFFFAHVGWLLCRKHPEVKEKGKTIDVSDLFSDPILRFQYDHYFALTILCAAIIPTVVPVYGWNESWTSAFFVATVMRYILSLHSTWLVNSAAHFYGNRPYDRNIYSAENGAVAFLTFGEGWHNYHHAFPWDYKTSELGSYSLNMTNAFIDFMAWIGWAYDRRTVSTDMVKRRVKRTGDGSHWQWGCDGKSVEYS